MLRSNSTNLFTSILWELYFLNRLRTVNMVTVKFRRYFLVLANEDIFLLSLDTLKCERGVMASCVKLGSKSCWGVDLFCEKLFRERRNSKTHRLEIAYGYNRTPHWLNSVHNCLKEEKSVELCSEGVGGTYFISDQKNNQIIGVFKPIDEEPGATLNPKKIIKEPLMPPGGGAIREVAAFLLDRKGTAGVPETILLQNIYHSNFNNQSDQLIPKTGSLQKFIPNIGNSESMGSSCFSVKDVHHIGILDIRLLNLDRNGENILLIKPDDTSNSEIRLVPIDHTYTLPESLGHFYFEWLYWRQSKIPFDSQTLEFIKAIDIDEDCALLHRLGIQSTAILNMRLATILLKKGATAGMSLFQLGSWIAPRQLKEVSVFRKLVERAQGEAVKLGPEKMMKKKSTDKIFEQLLDELISSCVES